MNKKKENTKNPLTYFQKVLYLGMLVEEPKEGAKRGRKSSKESSNVTEFETVAVPTCSMLGLTENETEALFRVEGTVYISAQAVEILNMQLAKIRREKRGA